MSRINPKLSDEWFPKGLYPKVEILYKKGYGDPDAREYVEGIGITVYLFIDASTRQRLYHPKKEGEMWLRLSNPSEVSERCISDLEYVTNELVQRGVERIRLYEVVWSSIWDEKYRGIGFGEYLYEGALRLSEVFGDTVMIVGDACGAEPFFTAWDDDTSLEAKRVYKSLQRRYIGKGLIVSSVLKEH